MNTLPELPSVTQLSPCVTRILGQNPGRYTLQGTNTYLIHHPSTSAAILLDTGQGIESYPSVLKPLLTPQTRLTIILSHWHEDHVNGLPQVLDLLQELGCSPPSIWKLAATEQDKDVEVEALINEGGVERQVNVPQPGLGLLGTTATSKIHRLQEGQLFALSDDTLTCFVADGPTLEVIHTPGHTSDSIMLLLHPKGAASTEPPILLTFDTVLGHGTAVFEDLGVYMSTLAKCIAKLESVTAGASQAGTIQLYPGHGEVIQDGKSKLKEYAKHRQEREDQVVEALKTAVDGNEATSATTLCEKIYGDTIPDALKLAATRGLILHLEKLEKERKVLRYEQSDKGHEIMPGWSDAWKWVGEEAKM